MPNQESSIVKDPLYKRILWKFNLGAPFFHCSYGPTKAGLSYDRKPHDGLNALRIGFGKDRFTSIDEKVYTIWFTSPVNWEITWIHSDKTRAFENMPRI